MVALRLLVVWLVVEKGNIQAPPSRKKTDKAFGGEGGMWVKGLGCAIAVAVGEGGRDMVPAEALAPLTGMKFLVYSGRP